jgi:hypothetical protein
MSLKDKLEIGLKPDAPYRRDNLPEFQQEDPDCIEAGEPGDGPRQRAAREDCDSPADARTTPGSERRRAGTPAAPASGKRGRKRP